MSTTTIRLPTELKDRLAKVAKNLGSTSHALILDAIAERIDAEERRNEFHEVAERRFAGIAKSGETIPWGEMKAYLQSRVAGKSVKRPKPRKLSR